MNLGFIEIIVLLLISGLLVALAVGLVIALFGSRRPKQHPPQNAREILDQRYARGEITREQYEQMRRYLEG